MTEVAPASKPHTRDLILDAAEHLIQTRGYNGFSYQDIADRVGIRKASIHFHFPSKTDMGDAVIERYAGRFSEGLDAMIARDDISAMDLYDYYCQPYLQFAAQPDMVCLSGALAGEMPSLPEAMQIRVQHFFTSHQAWLARILERGANRGELRNDEPAEKTARMIFGAMQGGLLVKRATGDVSQLTDIITVIKRHLRIGP